VIFAVTNFWEPFFAKCAELSKESDTATGEYAMAIEVARGKAIIDAAVQVLKEGVLERFIFSTLSSFKELSKGKYVHAYHFDGKAEITSYLKAQTDLWEKSSLLNMGFYTTNMVKFEAIRGFNDIKKSGKYVMHVACEPAINHPFVVPSDTGAFVDLLVRAPPQQDLLGVSESASYGTFMEIWTEITGVPSEVKLVSVEDTHKASPGGLAREAAESSATSAEFGWGNLVLPKDVSDRVI
jgi:hypothetical protein